MVGLIICTVLGYCALIYSVKMHAKAVFIAAKSLFYRPRVLNFVRYIVQYARITLVVCEAMCLACVRRGTA